MSLLVLHLSPAVTKVPNLKLVDPAIMRFSSQKKLTRYSLAELWALKESYSAKDPPLCKYEQRVIRMNILADKKVTEVRKHQQDVMNLMPNWYNNCHPDKSKSKPMPGSASNSYSSNNYSFSDSQFSFLNSTDKTGHSYKMHETSEESGEDIPSWFSCPASRQDFVELHGFEDEEPPPPKAPKDSQHQLPINHGLPQASRPSHGLSQASRPSHGNFYNGLNNGFFDSFAGNYNYAPAYGNMNPYQYGNPYANNYGNSAYAPFIMPTQEQLRLHTSEIMRNAIVRKQFERKYYK